MLSPVYPNKGIPNKWSICYLNSVMQALSYANMFSQTFLQYFGDTDKLKSGDRNKLELAKSVILELKCMREYGNKQRVLTDTVPVSLFKHLALCAPQFHEFRQEDAHEALVHILDALSEVSTRVFFNRNTLVFKRLLEDLKRGRIAESFNFQEESSPELKMEEKLRMEVEMYWPYLLYATESEPLPTLPGKPPQPPRYMPNLWRRVVEMCKTAELLGMRSAGGESWSAADECSYDDEDVKQSEIMQRILLDQYKKNEPPSNTRSTSNSKKPPSSDLDKPPSKTRDRPPSKTRDRPFDSGLPDDYLFVSNSVEHAWLLYAYRYRGIFTDIITGLQGNECECSKCRVKHCVFQPFSTLSLPLPLSGITERRRQVSLDDCFRQFSNEIQTSAPCKACGSTCQQTYRVSIAHWPKVLFIRLNRFATDRYGGCQKNSVEVSFPLRFGYDQVKFYSSATSIRRFHFRDSLATSICAKEEEGESGGRFRNSYELVAVVYHIGVTLHGGHYICVGRLSGGKWVKHDDDQSRIVERRAKEPDEVSDEAYILIYSRE